MLPSEALHGIVRANVSVIPALSAHSCVQATIETENSRICQHAHAGTRQLSVHDQPAMTHVLSASALAARSVMSSSKQAHLGQG